VSERKGLWKPLVQTLNSHFCSLSRTTSIVLHKPSLIGIIFVTSTSQLIQLSRPHNHPASAPTPTHILNMKGMILQLYSTAVHQPTNNVNSSHSRRWLRHTATAIGTQQSTSLLTSIEAVSISILTTSRPSLSQSLSLNSATSL
jgi:hypothetical protein